MCSSFSPLMQAFHFSQEIAREGFDWDSPFGAVNKVQEELEEVTEELRKKQSLERHKALNEEMGDLFLACCCLAMHCNVNPDEAILDGLTKLMKRYARFKFYVQERGICLKETSSKEISILWQLVKQEKASED
ncbi:MAG: hypothetical protein JSR85_02150 [Proteobacteria bacterium]|nr:hypothetical protein [Pseudomonadota bacterium]